MSILPSSTHAFSEEQLDRQDEVDNVIFDAIEMLVSTLDPTKKPSLCPDWDIELIGRVRDVVEEIFVTQGRCTKQEFYPSIETPS